MTDGSTALGFADKESLAAIKKHFSSAMLLLDGIPTPIFMKDAGFRYVHMNEAAQSLLGIESHDYFGKTDAHLFGSDVAELHRRSDMQALSSEQPVRYQQWLTFEGRQSCFLTTKQAITSIDGDQIAIIGIAQDVSQDNLSSGANNKLADSEFIANFSHELRTPLNAILGFSQLLSTQLEQGSDQQDSARLIEKAGRHLSDLIDQLIDLVKIESGVSPLNMEDVSLDAMLEECLSFIAPAALNRSIRIHADTLVDPVSVTADALKFKQVLLNLLSNAVKYNKPQGQIFVSVDVQSPWVTIRIKDTGLGIPHEKQSEVFQPFNRLGAEQTSIEGTGLGLSICKELVERMGGDIQFESEEKVGSTFSVRFKISDSNKHGVSKPRAQVSHFSAIEQYEALLQKNAPVRTNKKRVLYIEDNPTNARFLQLLLADNRNVDLVLASTGLEGIKKAKEYLPELILLDMRLPDMHGLEVLKELHKLTENSDCLVYAVTADAMPDQISEAKNAGIDGYLTKPLDIQAVRRLVS